MSYDFTFNFGSNLIFWFSASSLLSTYFSNAWLPGRKVCKSFIVSFIIQLDKNNYNLHLISIVYCALVFIAHKGIQRFLINHAQQPLQYQWISIYLQLSFEMKSLVFRRNLIFIQNHTFILYIPFDTIALHNIPLLQIKMNIILRRCKIS